MGAWPADLRWRARHAMRPGRSCSCLREGPRSGLIGGSTDDQGPSGSTCAFRARQRLLLHRQACVEAVGIISSSTGTGAPGVGGDRSVVAAPEPGVASWELSAEAEH